MDLKDLNLKFYFFRIFIYFFNFLYRTLKHCKSWGWRTALSRMWSRTRKAWSVMNFLLPKQPPQFSTRGTPFMFKLNLISRTNWEFSIILQYHFDLSSHAFGTCSLMILYISSSKLKKIQTIASFQVFKFGYQKSTIEFVCMNINY